MLPWFLKRSKKKKGFRLAAIFPPFFCPNPHLYSLNFQLKINEKENFICPRIPFKNGRKHTQHMWLCKMGWIWLGNVNGTQKASNQPVSPIAVNPPACPYQLHFLNHFFFLHFLFFCLRHWQIPRQIGHPVWWWRLVRWHQSLDCKSFFGGGIRKE